MGHNLGGGYRGRPPSWYEFWTVCLILIGFGILFSYVVWH